MAGTGRSCDLQRSRWKAMPGAWSNDILSVKPNDMAAPRGNLPHSKLTTKAACHMPIDLAQFAITKTRLRLIIETRK